jgi:hypothetical protein
MNEVSKSLASLSCAWEELPYSFVRLYVGGYVRCSSPCHTTSYHSFCRSLSHFPLLRLTPYQMDLPFDR